MRRLQFRRFLNQRPDYELARGMSLLDLLATDRGSLIRTYLYLRLHTVRNICLSCIIDAERAGLQGVLVKMLVSGARDPGVFGASSHSREPKQVLNGPFLVGLTRVLPVLNFATKDSMDVNRCLQVQPIGFPSSSANHRKNRTLATHHQAYL
jgi:hypothetical protein